MLSVQGVREGQQFCDSAMEFIHKREFLEEGDVVSLEIESRCRFMLLDDSNLRALKRGCRYQYYGDRVEGMRCELSVPHPGFWNIVIDTGGDTRNIRYTIDLLSAATV
ncbi:MAG: DUF1883 domain-containing protein [Verrucomicrobiota bacterium]